MQKEKEVSKMNKRGRKPGQLTAGSQFERLAGLQPGQSVIIENWPYSRNLPPVSRRPEFMRSWHLKSESGLIVYSPDNACKCVKITRLG